MKNAFGDTIDEAPAAKNEFGDSVEAAPTPQAPAFNPSDLFQGPANWDKVLPRATVSAIDSNLEGPDKALGRMRVANVAFLADRYKTTPDDVVARMPDYQKHFDDEVLKTGKTFDDAGFYSAVGAHLKKEGEEQTNFGALTVNMFAGLKGGQSFNQAFEAAKAEHQGQPGWDASREDFYRGAAKRTWDYLQQKQQAFAEPIKTVAAYMAEADQPDKTLTQASERNARRQKVASLLAGYPSDDASLIMDLAAGQAEKVREAGDAGMNLVEKGARRIERGTMGLLEGFIGAGQELGREIGSALGEDDGTAAGIDRRKAQILRQIDQRVHGQVDPLKGSNWVSNALLSTAEAAPRLASFLSPAGIVANGIATKEEQRGQFEDAGLSAHQADTLSYFTGAAATALNFVQAKMFFGKVPFASKIFDPITKEAGLGFGEIAKRAALAAGIEFPVQAGLAFSQQALPDVAQWIAGAFDKQIPGVDFGKTFDRVKANAPETLTGLIPIILFGAGVATFHDRAAGMAYVQNSDRLLALGFHPREVDDIMKRNDPLEIQQKISVAMKMDERFKAHQAQKAAVAKLDAEAAEARSRVYGPPAPPPPTAPAGAQSYSQQVAAKYPDVFHLNDPIHGIPVEVQAADGTVYPALLRGFADRTVGGELEPVLGRKVDGQWSHGNIREGEKVLTPIPTPDQWAKGVRDVFPTEAPATTPAAVATEETPLGPEHTEGENPNPTESPPNTQPPFIPDEERDAAKTQTQWARIAGSLRKLDRAMRTLAPGNVAGRRRLLEQRLEIQADAGIPGANEALSRYQEEQQRQVDEPDVAAAVRAFVAKNPLRAPRAQGEKVGTISDGELRTFRENLSPKDRKVVFRKDGRTKLDNYATDLVEHLQAEGIPGTEGDPEAVAQRLFGANETGVLDYLAEHLNNPRQPPEVPFIKETGPDAGRLGIARLVNGDYVVSDENGMPIGTAKSAETAAEIASEHHEAKAKETASLSSTPIEGTSGDLANLRAEATRSLNSPAGGDENLNSVFTPGPNRATVHATRAPGVEGSTSSPEVINALAKVLDAGGQLGKILRWGRVPKRLRAHGYYNPRDRIIRVRTANSIDTAAHEVAHGIEDALWGIGNVWKENKTFTTEAKAELTQLGHELYKTRKPAGGYEAEGFAEFFRLYVADPAKAEKKAPRFFDTWENTVLPANPELQKAVKAAQHAAVTFYGQGAVERARQGIVEQPGKLEQALKFTREQLTAARRKWIDAAAPIADFVEAANERRSSELPTAEDPFQTLTARRMTADSVAGYMATHGMLDFAGNKVGAPLQDAFSIVHGKEDDFVIYLWAKRAQALWNDFRNGDPRNPGLAKEDADFIAQHFASPEFDLAAQKVYDWNSGVLDYAAEASPDFAEVVKKIRAVDPGSYIPLFREFSALDDRYTGGGVSGKNLINRLKGSGRRILNPVEGMLTQAEAIVLKAHQKAVLDQIFTIAETTPGLGHLVTEVPRDMLPQRIAGDAIAQKVLSLMKELESGLDAAGRKAYAKLNKGKSPTPRTDQAKDLLKNAIDDEILTFFAPALKPKQNEAPVLPVFRNGTTKWFEMDPELYKAVTGMDHVRLPRALDFFLGMPARMTRLGTTGLRATFSLVTNPLRDLRTLQMNSQASANSAQLFGHWIASLRDAAVDTFTFGHVHSDWLDTAKRLGIEMAGSLTQDSRPLQTAARKLKRGGAWSPFDPKDSLEVLRNVLQFPETASRLAEVRAIAKDIGWDPSQPLTPEIAAKLATAGKQVTTDFTQAGEYARVINQMIPFFNAGIQGPVAHVRALQANPTRFVLRGLVGTAAALGLWWHNKDEEWWKEMNTNERYLYTYIPVGKELLRIPRSYEVDGLFMAATEALADAWHNEDPRRMKEWFGRYAQQFAQVDMVDGFPVPPLPVLPKLIAEQLANRNFFFDRAIVPRGEMENVRPEEQYNAFTTNVSIEAGRILGISPRRIDHTINSIFGPVGGDVVSLLGRGKDKIAIDREHEPADTPILGTLFQRGGQQARQPESIENLYRAYEEAIYTQHSKQEKETPEQKQVRLMLADAVKVQTALSMIERTVPERDKRQELEALRRSVAKNAVDMAKSGQVDRQPARQVLEEARRLAREQQIPIGDAPP